MGANSETECARATENGEAIAYNRVHKPCMLYTVPLWCGCSPRDHASTETAAKKRARYVAMTA